jgi:AcrR family transcriptional regulator
MTKRTKAMAEQAQSAAATDTEKEAPKQQRGAATSEVILRAAMRLMAENGYNGVSLRRISTEADVNLALMNYHFGTKAQLLEAIFQRAGAVINAERIRQLDALDQRYPDSPPPLEELLHAFISPTLTASKTDREDDLHFLRLSGRLATDPTPEVRKAIADVYDAGAVRFVRTLRQACDHISTEEFFMRLIFLYGAMVYTRADTGRVDSLAEKLQVALPHTPVEDACQYLIPFLAAGFRAGPSDGGPAK